MPTIDSSSKTFPSLVSLYILQKVGRSGIYPQNGLFVYQFGQGRYGGAYGPDGNRFDLAETGVKIITEVHERSVELTTPYIGRLKNHLLKAFPIAPASSEFIGVLVQREPHFDNQYLDLLLHSYIQELRSFYDTQDVESNLKVADDYQDVLFEQNIQQKREQRALQTQLEEERLRREEERARSAEAEKRSKHEVDRLQNELLEVRSHCERLMVAASAPAESTAGVSEQNLELTRVKATLAATAAELEAERARAERARDAEQTAKSREEYLDGEITRARTDMDRLRDELTKATELTEIVKRSRDKFRSMVDGFPVGVFVHQKLYEVANINATMQSYLARGSLNEAVGQKCYENIGLRLPCPGCPVQISFEDSEMHEEEIFFSVKGTQRHFRVIAIPSKDADGRLEGVTEYFEDITEKVGVVDQMNRLYLETDRLKRQIELQSPDTMQRLIERMMAVEREKKKLEAATLRDQGLVDNLRRSNAEMRSLLQRENDLRSKAVRIVNVARNLDASKISSQKKYTRLHSFIMDLLG